MAYLHWIFDAAILVILFLFYLHGRKKGFILTLCGLLAFFVALFGARILSQHLAPATADMLSPYFSTLIEQNVDAAILDRAGQFLTAAEGTDNPLISVLESVGLYAPFADSVRELLSQQTAQAAADTVAALAHAIAQVVARVLLFIVAFLLILLLWYILSRLLNLAARLPVIRTLNRLLGGLLGLGQGVLLLFFAAWILRLFGEIIPPETVANSYLLRFFLTFNPISILTGI